MLKVTALLLLIATQVMGVAPLESAEAWSGERTQVSCIGNVPNCD